MIKFFSGKVEKITFYGGGIKISTRENFLNYKENMLVLSAGIICNFSLFLIYFFVESALFQVFAVMNLIIGSFNLLPLRHFDGGKMLNLALQRYYPAKSEFISKAISLVFIGIILTFSIYLAVINQVNYLLLASLLFIFVSEFFS